MITKSLRSEEHTSELQSHSDLVCRLLLEKSGRKVTVSSYVENILLRHFEQYQDEINTLYESHFQKPV